MEPVPDSVHQLYVAYKHSTKYVMDWLWTTSGFRAGRPAQTHLTSTQDIIDSACLVRRNRVAVPGSVLSNLSNAIKKRRQVAKFYQNIEIARPSENHENESDGHDAFIDRLQCALSILSASERTTTMPKPGRAVCAVEGGSAKALNPFDLPKTDRERMESDDAPVGAADTQARADTLKYDEELLAAEDHFVLKDDDFAKRMEVPRFVTDMNFLLGRLNAVWSRAARNEIPLALAAWLSSCATAAVREQAMRLECIIPDASVLFEKWLCRETTIVDSTKAGRHSAGGQTQNQTSAYRALHQAYLVLKRRCPEKLISDDFSSIAEWQDPLDFVKKIYTTATGFNTDNDTHRKQRQADNLALEAIFANIQRLISVTSRKSKADSEWCFNMIDYMDKHAKIFLADDEAGIPIHAVFGLQLLLSSYKSFLWWSHRPNHRDCRSELLKIMIQIQKELSATAEAVETYVPTFPQLSSACNSLAERMKDSYKEKRFDLYARAPWTAGEHTMRNLHFCLEVGLNFCSRYNFVSAVLHFYNALRSLDSAFRRIPLLDQLCELFKDTLFLGTFPTENFSSHYRRSRGQKLTRDKSGKHIFKLLPNAAAPSCTVSASQVSALCQLGSESYQLTSSTCQMMKKALEPHLDHSHTSSRLKPESIPITDGGEPHEWTYLGIMIDSVLPAFQRIAMDEFSGTTPSLRIDLFAVLRFCLQLAHEMIPDFPEVIEIFHGERSANTGIAWIDMLLEDIAEHAKNPSVEPTAMYDLGVKRAKEVFTRFENRCPSTFPLWTL